MATRTTAKTHTQGQPQGQTRQPRTRELLLAEHRAARLRRDAAPLGGEEFRAACDEIARIELEIAQVERSMIPPRQ
jgi:hypothetical protein